MDTTILVGIDGSVPSRAAIDWATPGPRLGAIGALGALGAYLTWTTRRRRLR